MKSPCIAVPRTKGEEVRKTLMEGGLLRNDLLIRRDNEFIYFPVSSGDKNKVLDYAVIEKEFAQQERPTRSYKDLVNIPDDLGDFLPTSFDIVGSVAMIKLTDEVQEYAKDIAEAILKVNKSIETVAQDLGVEGEERIRNLHVVAGKVDTETIHREYGIELEMDPAKVYFSPRLATEHWRVAKLVEEEERVIDMFCGVGPFAILIAKNQNPEVVHAIDINEEAIRYLNKNIQRNKITCVTPHLGDSRHILPDLDKAHRIIMNLPFGSFAFLSVALTKIQNGGMIHYYEVLGTENRSSRLEEIAKIAEGEGCYVELVLEREVHTYSPDSNMYCFDLKVTGR